MNTTEHQIRIPKLIRDGGQDALSTYEEVFRSLPNHNTRGLYVGAAFRFFEWVAGQGQAVAVGDIESSHVRAYLDARRQSVSDSALELDLTALRKVLGHLTSRGVFSANPTEGVRVVRRATAGVSATINLEFLKDMIHKSDPSVPANSDDFRAGLVVLGGIFLGTDDLERLSQFTGIPQQEVDRYACCLRANGVWTPDGKTYADWIDSEHGDIGFWFDVMIARGVIERVPDPPAENEAL